MREPGVPGGARLRVEDGDLSMQLGEYALGERAADAGDARQVVDARCLDALQAAKMREQRLPLARSDAGDLLEGRPGPRLAAARPVPLYREAMRLVADLLQQVQTGVIGRQLQRPPAMRKDDFLEARLALGSL